ncbi:MAG TPA: cation:dicarboxylase symporter family transporter, partial [Solirubrobacteraceae bacterium]|nr:cation:dicarboxylase symporter family transporter [Solirubrobacteraceae bacterium]
ISATVKLLFLAHLFGVPLSPARIATFVVTVLLVSFTTLGVPNGGGGFRTTPAYLAAGMPIEGIVLLAAVDSIQDVVRTVLNVTGDLCAATILGRFSGRVAPAQPEGELPA